MEDCKIKDMIDFNESEQNERMDEIRKKEEEELSKMLAARHKIPYINLFGFSINTDALRVIPEQEAMMANIAAFDLVGKKLSVGVLSVNNEETMKLLESLDRKGYDLGIFMVSEESLKRAWSHYAEISQAEANRAGSLEISEKAITELLDKLKTVADVKASLESVITAHNAYRISVIMENMIAGALVTDASDIHIEPEENIARLRYRLDGVLVNILEFDRSTMDALISRIKLLSGMILNIHNKAQDGRFSIKLPTITLEIRSSVLPGAYSESIVMRLLNPKSIAIPVESMGMDDWLLNILLKEIEKPNGMILTTGPTGSGKTTTLYAFLRKVNSPEVKIITIEDPIEYHLPGVTQTQTDEDHGYNFLSGLRAALRQDPDVIMVGEIRDDETAHIAVQAALTGHLVLSTLHTNNAAGTFRRLINLKVDPHDIFSAINVALAQRLMRKLCTTCRKEKVLAGEEKTLFDNVLASVRNKDFIKDIQTEKIYVAGDGCEKCNGIGYKGRIAIFEAILKSNELEKALIDSVGEFEIKKLALDQGMLDMRQDGIIKILKGITSLDELSRVIDINEKIL